MSGVEGSGDMEKFHYPAAAQRWALCLTQITGSVILPAISCSLRFKGLSMKTLLSITLLAFLMSAVAWGQAAAQIHGTVQDSTGAAVPGATMFTRPTRTTARSTGIWTSAIVSRTGGNY